LKTGQKTVLFVHAWQSCAAMAATKSNYKIHEPRFGGVFYYQINAFGSFFEPNKGVNWLIKVTITVTFFISITQHFPKAEVRDMSNMSKLASGAAYGASAGTVANGLLTRLSPDEWSAIGVIAGIVVALLTFAINWYYKRKTTLAQIEALRKWPVNGPTIEE